MIEKIEKETFCNQLVMDLINSFRQQVIDPQVYDQ